MDERVRTARPALNPGREARRRAATARISPVTRAAIAAEAAGLAIMTLGVVTLADR